MEKDDISSKSKKQKIYKIPKNIKYFKKVSGIIIFIIKNRFRQRKILLFIVKYKLKNKNKGKNKNYISVYNLIIKN